MGNVLWCDLTVGGLMLNFLGSFFILQSTFAIKINELSVPEVVQFGSPALLDCNYTLEEQDLDLVVKWYFQRSLIYQWIPTFKPVVSGVFRGRVNLDYWSSDDPNSIHRALYIVNPDPSMSGEYTCSVSTIFSEDASSKRMLVFVPEKNLELQQKFTDSSTVQVFCSAERVFPKPSINLYVGKSEINGSRVTVHNGEKFFNIQATANVTTSEEPTEFSCQLDIPEANYTARKEAVYFSASNGTKTFEKTAAIYVLQVLLVFRKFCTEF